MIFSKNITILLIAIAIAGTSNAQPAGVIMEGQSFFGGDMLRPIQPSHYYQEQFLRDSTYTFLLESDTNSASEWLLSEKLIYAYNPQGLKVAQVRSKLEGDKWQQKAHYQYAYNLDNELIETLKSRNDTLGEGWVLDERLLRYYTYYGVESELLTEKWDGLRWTSYMRTTKDYNDDTHLIRRTRYLWSDSADQWNPSSRMLYTYTDGDMLRTETVQMWLDSVGIWLNQSKRTFHYDDSDNLIETVLSSWDPVQDAFVADALTTWGYDENGQMEITDFKPLNGKDISGFSTTTAAYNDEGLLNEMVSQAWDAESESWEPYRYDQHFWSTYLTGNPETGSSDISCQFANPYIQGLPWHCASLKSEVQYTLDVYDLVGRHYHTSTFMGHHTFRVRANLPPGFYLFVIRGGLDQHTEKVIVR